MTARGFGLGKVGLSQRLRSQRIQAPSILKGVTLSFCLRPVIMVLDHLGWTELSAGRHRETLIAQRVARRSM